MKLTTLDRFFVRRDRRHQEGEGTATQSGEALSDQQAEAGAQAEGQVPRAAVSGTLDAFLVRRDAPVEEDSPTERLADACHRLQPLPRSLIKHQLVGRLDPGALAYTRHLEASRMQQLASLGTHPWGRGALSAHGVVTVPCEGREGGAVIQALQFDPSGGELLVAGSDEGLLSVHSTQQLLQQLPRAPDGGLAHRPGQNADPLLLLDCGMPRLHSVRWDPRQGAVVGVTSTATRQLLLFDLEHTQGRPKEALSVPAKADSLGGVGSAAVGLTDLAFLGGGSGEGAAGCGGGGYVVAAGAMGGEVFLWDRRARRTPQACLQPKLKHCGAVHSLVAAAGGSVIVAGTQGGEVNLWDLRGGSSGTVHFGSGGVYHHPLLDSVNLRLALALVPGLASQTAIPASGVQWLQCDPLDERRLGFHLGCGWTGVLDLLRQAVTHLHAPPQHGAAAWPDDPVPSAEAPLGRWMQHRRPCWAAGPGHRLLVPTCHAQALQVLDCCPSRHAGCAVPAAEEGEALAESVAWGRGRAQAPLPAVDVQLSQPAICVAAHPGGDLVVAGGTGGRLSVVMGQ